MIKLQGIQHRVAVAGTITDSITRKPIPDALVEIRQGPAAYQAKVNILSGDPAWVLLDQRFGRTRSRYDGLFFFLDLSPGNYLLRVSAPQLGSRYGVVEVGPYTVQAGRDANGRVRVTQADVVLSPTRIEGHVTRSDNNQPVAGAQVRLRGAPRTTVTAGDGGYLLSDLVAGNPTVEVSAATFQTIHRTVQLQAGQLHAVNITLQPSG